MSTNAVRKVTISLPSELVEYADRLARRSNSSRSQVISQALQEVQARERGRLAIEGYRFYAGEATEFAAASAQAIAEATGQEMTGATGHVSETW